MQWRIQHPVKHIRWSFLRKKIENLWVLWIFAEELSSRRLVNTRVSLITSGCIYNYYTLGEKNKLKWRYIRWSYDVIYHLPLRFPTVISKNCFYLFFFIIWQAPIPPSCRIPCSNLFYMLWVLQIYYAKPKV